MEHQAVVVELGEVLSSILVYADPGRNIGVKECALGRNAWMVSLLRGEND